MATTVTDPKFDSPKRKRESSGSEPFTAAQAGLHPISHLTQVADNSTTSSPSRAVSTKFERLRIKEAVAKIDFGKSGTLEPSQKRMRSSRSTINTPPSIQLEDAEAFARSGDATFEIPETPLFPVSVSHRSAQSPAPQVVKPTPKRMKSPPPPARSPRSSDLQSTPNLLTWQEFEITGYDINGPDDDGEGINGLGFKPTPTMAYARSQDRKRQVREWRAREARDARQKRSERRRNGESEEHGALHENLSRVSQQNRRAKTVRFAEDIERSTL